MAISYDEFNQRLKDCNERDLDSFIQKNILNVMPVVFNGSRIRQNAFKRRLAKKFGISSRSIHIVGSAGIGFSYHQGGKPFDHDSDIDVAIISEKLFEEYSKLLSTYHYDILYNKVPLGSKDKKMYQEFLSYYAVGWLRPDKGTTIMNSNPRINSWWDYFKSISYNGSEIGNYKVSAGIYKSKHYLIQYQKIRIQNHRKGII